MKRRYVFVIMALAVVALSAAYYFKGDIAFALQWRSRSADAQASACELWQRSPGEAWRRFNDWGRPIWPITSTEFSSNMQSRCA